ncbi:PilN domain-containing protein [Rubinisphaera margarita]|uniref:PilN domain-containing protein n=1 Tax=Rubinisphaera margarita TaxID=2909586 RepID=UPI001EE91E93|nr:PilN domain-containing protein [Rubinisphaera margarita]MCG6155833.1 PilN domain-containing protein [Rubinisphaera margarita]
MSTADFNLVPKVNQFELISYGLLRQWLLVALIVMLVMAVVALFHASDVQNVQEQLQKVEQSHEPVRELLAQTAEVRQKLAEVQRQERRLENLIIGPTPVDILGAIAAASIATEGGVVVSSWSANLEDRKPPASKGTPPVTPASESISRVCNVSIVGTGKTDSDVGEMITSLETGLFTNVDLLSATHIQSEEEEGKQFQIQAEVGMEISP